MLLQHYTIVIVTVAWKFTSKALLGSASLKAIKSLGKHSEVQKKLMKEAFSM